MAPSALDRMPHLVWRSSDCGEWVWCGPQWSSFTGQSLLESLHLGWLRAVHPEDRAATMDQWMSARDRKSVQVHHRILRAHDHTYVWHVTQAVPMAAISSTAVEWLGTCTEIDTLKNAETQLQHEAQEHEAALQNKDMLLRELHHQLNNNLQVVVSLLSLQARELVDPAAKAMFHLTRDRVLSIAAVHGLLHRSQERAVDLAVYAKHLVSELLRLYGQETYIQVQITGERMLLSAERAVTFGLLLSEIVARALNEHSESAERTMLRLHFSKVADRGQLAIGCDGVSWNLSGSGSSSQLSGREMVEALVNQLSGHVKHIHGETVELAFPLHTEEHHIALTDSMPRTDAEELLP